MNPRPLGLPAAAGATALVLLLCLSCNPSLLSDMERSTADPTIAAPNAASFVYENRVDLTWTADANADLYVLYRAVDAASPSWETVYRGTGTSYSEAGCADQIRYLYSLSKTRGTASFGPSEAVLGVGSDVSRDGCEPNDDESEATPLLSTQAANLYYYTSSYQQEGASIVVQDVDWYAVTVPADRTANIVVTQVSPALSGGATNTWMYFYEKGMNPQQIVNNQAIAVTNYSTSAQTILFKIYPVPSSFPANGGGELVDYTVSLYSITSN